MSLTKLVRRTHMYLALFLMPWMLMFAISTIAMNHRPLLSRFAGETAPPFETEREIDFPAEFSTDTPPEMIAGRILQHLRLDGRHDVRGSLDSGRLVVLRQTPSATWRITYATHEQKLLVERRVARAHDVLNRVHSRRGYGHGYLADNLWALHVDLVIAAIMFWSLTGVWLWLSLQRTRGIGAICLALGAGLFCLFVFSI